MYRSKILLLVAGILFTFSSVVISFPANVTNRLLRDIMSQWEITEMYCALQIFTINNNFDFSIVTHFNEPFTLQNVIQDKNISCFTRRKYKSNCWTTVVEIQPLKPSEVISGVMRNINSVYDQYIFVSQDSDFLETNLRENFVVDKICRKYGMSFRGVADDAQFTYFLEPEVYTGYFVKSTSLRITKRLKNLNGRTLRVPFYKFPPSIMKESDTITGIQNHFILELARRANCTLTLYDDFKAPGFGAMKNGSWTGIMGELSSGRGELTPVLALSLDRFPYLTVSDPTLHTSLSFFVKASHPAGQWHSFRFVAFFIFVHFVVLFLFKNSFQKMASSHQNKRKKKMARTLICIWVVLFSTFGIMCRCKLVTFLTVTEKLIMPNTLQELYDSKYAVILWQVAGGGMEMEIFRTTQNPIVKGIRNYMKTDNDIRKCLNAAAKGAAACIGWKSALESAISTYAPVQSTLNDLQAGRESVTDVNIVVGMRKASIFLENVNRHILEVRSAYLEWKWERDYYSQLRRKSHQDLTNTTESTTTLDVNRTGSIESEEVLSKFSLVFNIVYLVISFGCLISVSCFLFEVVGKFCLVKLHVKHFH